MLLLVAGAATHDGGDPVTEPLRDDPFAVFPVHVLDVVVEQSGDGLVGVAAILDHEPCHAQEMAEVGDQRARVALGALASLVGVATSGECHGLREPIRVDPDGVCQDSLLPGKPVGSDLAPAQPVEDPRGRGPAVVHEQAEVGSASEAYA